MTLDPVPRADVDAAAVRRAARRKADAILASQLADGERVVRERWAAELLDRMAAIGPHVPREDLVRRFHGRTPAHAERLIGEAWYLEFANHRPVSGKR